MDGSNQETGAEAQETGAEADAAPAGPVPFGLIWTIKPTFIDYVSRMSDGKIYITDGVGVNKENELLFPFDQEATEGSGGTGQDPAEVSLSFRGVVDFRAHFGMLAVQVKHPRVQLRGGDGELTVADPDAAEGARLRLVTFTVAGPEVKDGVRYWAADDVRLTAAGVPLFGDVYPAEEPFAPFLIAIPAL